MASNIFNSQAQYPNIDQLSSNERGMYMKEHEFETSLSTMMAELNSLLDTSSSSDSAIQNNNNRVQNQLNTLAGRIESEMVSLVERYIEQFRDEKNQVDAAYERLYSKIYSIIQSANVNIQNRTSSYDIISSYRLQILDKINNIFGKSSPYSDGRSKIDENRYSVRIPNSLIRLRDVDEGMSWRTTPIIIDPNITQEKTIKICEFTPLQNKTILDSENYVPTFLAEIIISGDLYSFKGILKSVTKDRNARFEKSHNRAAMFVADYFINQDVPFSIKVLYDKTRNKVAVALKYDETEDKFTSIIKLDFSINLLVGYDLEFTNKNTCVIMDGAGLNSYTVSIIPMNQDQYINIGEHRPNVSYGGTVLCHLSTKLQIDLTSSYGVNANFIIFEYVNANNYRFDKDDIISVYINNTEISYNDIIVENNTNKTILKISDPSRFAQAGVDITANIVLKSRYILNDSIKTIYKYTLPDINSDNSKIKITVNGIQHPYSKWSFDKVTGLLQINDVTGNLIAEVSSVELIEREEIEQS